MAYFLKQFYHLSAILCQKSYTQTGSYDFTTMIFICHPLECRDLKEEVFLCGRISFLWRWIFPVRLKILFLTHPKSEKVSSDYFP